jgi:hypothetical protein
MQRATTHAVVPQICHARVPQPGLQQHTQRRHQNDALKYQLSLGTRPQATPLDSARMRHGRCHPLPTAFAEQHVRIGALKRKSADAAGRRTHTARGRNRRGLLRQRNSSAARLRR